MDAGVQVVLYGKLKGIGTQFLAQLHDFGWCQPESGHFSLTGRSPTKGQFQILSPGDSEPTPVGLPFHFRLISMVSLGAVWGAQCQP